MPAWGGVTSGESDGLGTVCSGGGTGIGMEGVGLAGGTTGVITGRAIGTGAKAGCTGGTVCLGRTGAATGMGMIRCVGWGATTGIDRGAIAGGAGISSMAAGWMRGGCRSDRPVVEGAIAGDGDTPNGEMDAGGKGWLRGAAGIVTVVKGFSVGSPSLAPVGMRVGVLLGAP